MQKSEYMVLEVCTFLCMLSKTMCFIPNIRCLNADTKGKVKHLKNVSTPFGTKVKEPLL